MKKQIIKGSELADKELEIQEDGSLRIIEKKGRFIPKENDGFYFISTFGIILQRRCELSDKCQWLINHNLVFRTEKECLEYKRYLELLDEYSFDPSWNDRFQDKWFPFYNHNVNEICYSTRDCVQQEAHYFPSKNRVMEFVEKAGESNVKKFMFDIWED